MKTVFVFRDITSYWILVCKRSITFRGHKKGSYTSGRSSSVPKNKDRYYTTVVFNTNGPTTLSGYIRIVFILNTDGIYIFRHSLSYLYQNVWHNYYRFIWSQKFRWSPVWVDTKRCQGISLPGSFPQKNRCDRALANRREDQEAFFPGAVFCVQVCT